LIYGKPLSSTADNYMSIINDLLASIYLYTILCLSDFNVNLVETRQRIGLVLVSIVVGTICLNIMRFIYKILYALKLKVKEYYLKKKQCKVIMIQPNVKEDMTGTI
jgi:hypothetical protein